MCVGGEYKEKQPLWPEGGSQHKDVHREVEPSNVQTVSEFLSSFLRATVISPNSAHTSSRKKERKKEIAQSVLLLALIRKPVKNNPLPEAGRFHGTVLPAPRCRE